MRALVIDADRWSVVRDTMRPDSPALYLKKTSPRNMKYYIGSMIFVN